MQPEKQGEQNYWQPAQGTVSGQVSDTPTASPTPPTPSTPPPPPPPVGEQTTTSTTSTEDAASIPSAQPTAPIEPLANDLTPPPPPPPPVEEAEPVTWSASEFVQHEKSPLWFIVLGIVGIALLAASILLLKDWFFAVIVVVLLVGVGIVAARKPRTLQYAIDSKGIHIGETLHPYQKFHAFSIVNEDETWSIILMPNARFSPTITLYFAKDQGEEIVDALNNYLPVEEHKVDLVDKISRKIRF